MDGTILPPVHTILTAADRSIAIIRRLEVHDRWEKKVENYLALVHFACAWITFRAAELFG
jgi:hypothetical protein